MYVRQKGSFWALFATIVVVAIGIRLYASSHDRLTDLGLPQVGSRVLPTAAMHPVVLTGMRVHKEDPYAIDFFVDTGDSPVNSQKTKTEIASMVRFFFAALAVPREQWWVNLSPYEKDRIVPESLGKTDLGTDLLAQDYMLKQLTASLSDPSTSRGKAYWTAMRAAAGENATAGLDTFNKIWIVPDKALLEQNDGTVAVAESSLKALLDTDYQALKHGKTVADGDRQQAITAVMKQHILPLVEAEVNRGATFARLRQIYSAMILASWFKEHVTSDLDGSYADKQKVTGITVKDARLPEKIFGQYVAAFEKGVYKHAERELGPSGMPRLRTFVSGGFAGNALLARTVEVGKKQIIGRLTNRVSGSSIVVPVRAAPIVSSSIETYKRYVVSGASLPLSADVVGLKTLNLAIMKDKLGLPVPEFAVVTAEMMRDTGEQVDWLSLADAVLADPEIQKIPADRTLALRPSGVVNMPGLAMTVKGVKKDRAEIAAALERIAADWKKGTVESYREKNNVAVDSMFAFVVQREVIGYRNARSGAGVFYTRHPEAGEDRIVGNYCEQAPGEYVRNGEGDKAYLSVESDLGARFPRVFTAFQKYKIALEKEFRYPQEVEFVIEDDKPYIVQTVDADIAPTSEEDVLKAMLGQGLVTQQDYTARISRTIAVPVYALTDGALDQERTLRGEIHSLSGGAAIGHVAFSVKEAEHMRAVRGRDRTPGDGIIVVSERFDDELLQAVIDRRVNGVVVGKGSFSAHVARIAREMGIPVISLDLELPNAKSFFSSLKPKTIVGFDAQALGVVLGDPAVALTLTAVSEQKIQRMQKIVAIKKTVKEYAQGKSFEYLALLRSVLYANVLRIGEKQHDAELVDALDLITTALHEAVRELSPDEAARYRADMLSADCIAVIGRNPVFVLDDVLFAKAKDAEMFLHDVTSWADRLWQRYQGLQASILSYPAIELSGGGSAHVQDGKLPVEFSVEFGGQFDFFGENVNALAMVQGMRFYAQVVPFPVGWVTLSEKNVEVSLSEVEVAADSGDHSKLRVKGVISLPDDLPERITLTLFMRTADAHALPVLLDSMDRAHRFSKGVIVDLVQFSDREGLKDVWMREYVPVSLAVNDRHQDSGSPQRWADDLRHAMLVRERNAAGYDAVGALAQHLTVLEESVFAKGRGFGEGTWMKPDKFLAFARGDGREHDLLVYGHDRVVARQEQGIDPDGSRFDTTVPVYFDGKKAMKTELLAEMLTALYGPDAAYLCVGSWEGNDKGHNHYFKSMHEYRFLAVPQKTIMALAQSIAGSEKAFDFGRFVRRGEDGSIKDLDIDGIVTTIYQLSLRGQGEVASAALKGGFDFSSDLGGIAQGGARVIVKGKGIAVPIDGVTPRCGKSIRARTYFSDEKRLQ